MRTNRRGLRPIRGFAPDPTGAAPLRPALEKTLPREERTKEAWRRSFAPAFRLILQLENATPHPKRSPMWYDVLDQIAELVPHLKGARCKTTVAKPLHLLPFSF